MFITFVTTYKFSAGRFGRSRKSVEELAKARADSLRYILEKENFGQKMFSSLDVAKKHIEEENYLYKSDVIDFVKVETAEFDGNFFEGRESKVFTISEKEKQRIVKLIEKYESKKEPSYEEKQRLRQENAAKKVKDNIDKGWVVLPTGKNLSDRKWYDPTENYVVTRFNGHYKVLGSGKNNIEEMRKQISNGEKIFLVHNDRPNIRLIDKITSIEELPIEEAKKQWGFINEKKYNFGRSIERVRDIYINAVWK